MVSNMLYYVSEPLDGNNREIFRNFLLRLGAKKEELDEFSFDTSDGLYAFSYNDDCDHCRVVKVPKYDEFLHDLVLLAGEEVRLEWICSRWIRPFDAYDDDIDKRIVRTYIGAVLRNIVPSNPNNLYFVIRDNMIVGKYFEDDLVGLEEISLEEMSKAVKEYSENLIRTLRKEDLEGEIKDFPIPVVKRMLKYQLEQTGVVNTSIFCFNRCADKVEGGFDWDKTPEYNEWEEFWDTVIREKDFAYYFEKYPEELPKEDNVEINVKDGLNVLSSIMEDIAKRLAKVEEELKSLKEKYDKERKD